MGKIKHTQHDTRQRGRREAGRWWWWGCTSISRLSIADLRDRQYRTHYDFFPWTEVAFSRQADCAHVAARRRDAHIYLPPYNSHHYNLHSTISLDVMISYARTAYTRAADHDLYTSPGHSAIYLLIFAYHLTVTQLFFPFFFFLCAILGAIHIIGTGTFGGWDYTLGRKKRKPGILAPLQFALYVWSCIASVLRGVLECMCFSAGHGDMAASCSDLVSIRKEYLDIILMGLFSILHEGALLMPRSGWARYRTSLGSHVHIGE